LTQTARQLEGEGRVACAETEGNERLGLEPTDASGMNNNDLRQSSQEGAAESGAVGADPSTITLESLAAALLALPPADRTRLAALLAGQAEGEARS
jgi:hypothetical protein